jgi:hypothetical protein
MVVGVKMGRDNIARRWEAPSVMTGGKFQAHALELGVALALAILERSAGGRLTIRSSTSLRPQAPLLRPSLQIC